MAKIAVVAVHGVIPQARYGFQDQVAEQLAIALGNTGDKASWQMSVVFPKHVDGERGAPSTDPTTASTISRVHRADEADPDEPSGDFFDVHEAYWSPIDKGKTNGASVLQWLLTTIFLPVNDTARYLERFSKIAWDIGYLAVAIVLGAVLLGGSLVLAAWALGATQVAQEPTFWNALAAVAAPLTLIQTLRPGVIAALLTGFVGAYLLAQTVRAVWSFVHNARRLLAGDQVQFWSRVVAIAIMAALGGVGVFLCAMTRLPSGERLGLSGLLLVLGAASFQSGRALMLWFIANFFGDVQIYTTRDENSTFFALREQILELVTGTVVTVANGQASGFTYDRVYVMGHSLGSTIALDALMRIYNAQKAGTVTNEAWERIRGFVSFGTALEKTKYFFNAWSPTPSQSYEEWQNDLYGPLFTRDPAALIPSSQIYGIYWLNCWYFSDFVADQINSYRSFVLPGGSMSSCAKNRAAAREHAQSRSVATAGRLVADNRGRFGDFAPFRLHFVTHGDYIEDQQWFWSTTAAGELGAIDVLTAGVIQPAARLHALRDDPQLPQPYDTLPKNDAGGFLTRDVFK